jgi:hypothetical protein
MLATKLSPNLCFAKGVVWHLMTSMMVSMMVSMEKAKEGMRYYGDETCGREITPGVEMERAR